jgi:DNA-binding response OmpR family regulator
MKQRILVVADDVSLRATLARWPMAAGYAVELAESTKRARDLSGAGIALAILAPERMDDAEDLARGLADAVGRLVLITAPADKLAEKLASAASVGTLSTPPQEADVLACVDRALGAVPTPETGPDCLRFEGYTLDIAGRSCLNASGAEVQLTRAEFSLLTALARRPGRVLSRDDLHRAMVGRDAEADDRSVDVLISRLRRKIEADPRVPRMIVTVPGQGYKFGVKTKPVASVDEIASPPSAAAVAAADETGSRKSTENKPKDAAAGATIIHTGAGGGTERRTSAAAARRLALIAAAATMFVGIAGVLAAFWPPSFATKTAPAAATRPKFNAAVIPLVTDLVRKDLASYASRPDFKALAISSAAGDGWGLSFGAPDEESARKEALERCGVRSAQRVCRMYAVGMDVVWSPASLALPLPADIHTESLDIPLAVAEIPMLSDADRKEVVEKYLNGAGHKALAIRRGHFYFNSGNSDGATAERLTVERCADYIQSPCLLLSVDGMLTVRIPKSRPVEDIFLVTTDLEMSDQDREQVGRIYQQREWRALARGGSGRWYPVANAASESDAVDAALSACAERDRECRLYAIGNFRVAANR